MFDIWYRNTSDIVPTAIFTVTQLSYTFRARRRPKRLAGKREKYHHSLKALSKTLKSGL